MEPFPYLPPQIDTIYQDEAISYKQLDALI